MRKLALLPVAALALAACAESPSAPSADDAALNHEPGRQSAVAPQTFPGNFVAEDDDQICYNMFASAPLGELHGFKVDPPVAGTFAGITVGITGGKYLDWSSGPGVTVLAVVMKGGPAYNLYDYLNGPAFPYASDQWLHSPLQRGKVPDVSHFNFCYQDADVGGAGCTPGYWRNHADRWLGVSPGDDFDATFDVNGFAPDITLGQAIWAQGGDIYALARHATAGLLNAHGGVPNVPGGETVAYAYSVAQVLAMVKAAIDSGDPAQIEATKDLLAAANEAGCPLGGTRAVKVQ